MNLGISILYLFIYVKTVDRSPARSAIFLFETKSRSTSWHIHPQRYPVNVKKGVKRPEIEAKVSPQPSA
jgi:hypothetical protein